MASAAGRRRGRGASAAGRREESPKKVKIQEETEEVDPFKKACQEAVALAELDQSLTPAALGTLRIAAPFCLRQPRAERHEYQETIVALLETSVRRLHEMETEAVETLKKALAEAQEDAQQAEARLSEAKDKLQGFAEAKAVAEAEMQEFVSNFREESAKLDTVQAAAQKCEERHARLLSNKNEREKVVDAMWASLRDGLAGRGWKEKKKFMDSVVSVLHECDVAGSLLAACQVALKASPADRGPFAKRSIQFAEDALKKRIADLSEKIRLHEEEVSEQAKVSAAVSQEHAAASEALAEKRRQFDLAETGMATATAAQKTATAALKKFGEKSKSYDSQLSRAEDKLAFVKARVDRFQALAEGGEHALAPTLEPKSAEAATTAPA